MKELMRTVKIGFTGTQKGMSDNQKKTLETILWGHQLNEFHHGDCIGADEQAHEIALYERMEIIIHPPLDEEKRAFCRGAMVVKAPHTYLVRNQHIVESVDILIAAPQSNDEILRSGTWSTVRYARQSNVPVILLER